MHAFNMRMRHRPYRRHHKFSLSLVIQNVLHTYASKFETKTNEKAIEIVSSVQKVQILIRMACAICTFVLYL